MSLMAKIITFFPALFYLFCVMSIKVMVVNSFWTGLSMLLFTLYLLPVLSFRVHNVIFPLRAGKTDLASKEYSPWYGSYCFQRIYNDMLFLESILRSFPGVYSSWLRLWGAKIGKGIMWTPNIQILDRSMIELGDRVFFGNEVYLCSHAVTKMDGQEVLGVYPIKIGEQSFVGAQSKIGPGAEVLPHSKLKYLTTVGFKERYPKDEIST